MNNTKFLILTIAGLILLGGTAYGATILFPQGGGTGIGTAVAGDVGKVLKVLDDSPFTYELATDATGAGGGTYPFTPTTIGGTDHSASTTRPFYFARGLLAASTTAGVGVFGSLTATSSITFNGVTGTAWSDFCDSITGGGGLCDGNDGGGGGGGSNPFSSLTVGGTVYQATTSSLYLSGGFITGTSTIGTLTATSSATFLAGLTITCTGCVTDVNTADIALGGGTSGNYLRTLADDGQSTITVTGSGAEDADVTLRVVDVICTNCLTTTEIDESGNWTGTLDSIEGASFLRSDATDQFTSGILSTAAGTQLGVGSSTPWGLLSVEILKGDTTNNKPAFVVAGNGTSTPAFVVGANGYVGLGTSTPSWMFNLSSSTPILGFTDNNASLNQRNAYISFNNGKLQFGTSTDTNINATSSLIEINGNAPTFLSVGSSTPTSLYSGIAAFQGPIFVGRNSVNSVAVSTSTFDGNIRVTGVVQTGSGSMYMDNNGIRSGNGNIELNADGTFALRNLPTDTTIGLGGTICLDSVEAVKLMSAPGTCIVSSERFKNTIEPLTRGIEIILKLDPASFKYNDKEETRFGLIAERVAEVSKELVIYADGRPYTLDYNGITAILINAVQEIWNKITNIETRVEKLEKQNAELLKRIEALEK